MTNQKIAQIDEEISVRTDQFMSVKTEYDKLCKTIELSRSKRFSLQNQLAVAQSQLNADLHAFHFSSREMYLEYRAMSAQEAALEEALQRYAIACAGVRAELSALELELQGKSLVDVHELAARHRELSDALEALNRQKVQLLARIQINTQALDAITARFGAMDTLYAQFLDLSELSRLAGGNNAQRLAFESYVLSAYFDDIIRLANIRLACMTSSRYELRRRTEREKFGRASGLSLEMLDHYSGKARHVSTLSGGESFQTALALALSLADIVQMYAGGVVIETMFLDEGFGTLDDEALNSAVQALMTLGQSGRSVGIISHVSELKERIPTRIQVEPGKCGSHCLVCL